MNTVDLLNGLRDFMSMLVSIKERAASQRPGAAFSGAVLLQYDFVKVKIGMSGNVRDSPWMECSFRIGSDNVSLTDFYCDDADEPAWKEYVLKNCPSVWNPKASKQLFSPEIQRYLEIADTVAKEGYLCGGGDNYRPGYYSAIGWSEDKIELKQVNWHNAKSSAHKSDYHMRELQFVIPFVPRADVGGMIGDSFRIGQMMISFSDRSSAKNKSCGDKILEKIKAAPRG